MDKKYDAIVLGTGLKECILSGILSTDKCKVLHLDRNDYYGAESTSMNLNQLFEKFKKGTPPASLGSFKDYNVDLIPKFVMANGILVKILLHTDVTKYLEFKSVDGSYVFKKNKIHKVPASDKEAMSSPLLGMIEKTRCKKFFSFVAEYDKSNTKTHKGYDLNTMNMEALFKKFSLESDTIDFIGHAIALFRDDSYLTRPAIECVERMQLYFDSLSRYGRSPYIYPLYGLGELPQGFARLSSIYGGTYMLGKPIDEILYKDGRVCGIKSEGEVANCDYVVADPSYFPDKVKKVGQVVRAICILDAPIPHTKDAESVQIIIPQKQVKRNSDIYVFMVSAAHCVVPKGKFVATVSTTVETSDPEKELQPGLDLLGPIVDKFVAVSDVFEPTNDPTKDGVYITTSYDPTSHFETTCLDVLELYKRIRGKDLDLTPKESEAEA
mmetsp:Transcript_28740/g.72271  ORF Transcript_28740/g.72271 Transcript_28740/m.72271 type:complete len:439 (-) Transcript_28740:37-1353(-)|eukprot:CAMPEP_0177669168 /NCGR_PEP_ID=MMETSP0447-20121125/23272_1 /TAXON_ID=0 /ORGANISM="Stygamoeba regulata, Strain BSH-02190019" /LENGTH=438 /DNA_ID=CAMNT_0019175967 /DNA_START=30 /DNA_END=1346 /DNA_ORIENTATION=-